MPEYYYEKLGKLTEEIEGEVLQEIYFHIKNFKSESKDIHDNERIPTVEEIESIRDFIKNIFSQRHKLFIKNNYYDFF